MKYKPTEILEFIKGLLALDAEYCRKTWANGGENGYLTRADTCEHYLEKIKELENES